MWRSFLRYRREENFLSFFFLSSPLLLKNLTNRLGGNLVIWKFFFFFLFLFVKNFSSLCSLFFLFQIYISMITSNNEKEYIIEMIEFKCARALAITVTMFFFATSSRESTSSRTRVMDSHRISLAACACFFVTSNQTSYAYHVDEKGRGMHHGRHLPAFGLTIVSHQWLSTFRFLLSLSRTAQTRTHASSFSFSFVLYRYFFNNIYFLARHVSIILFLYFYFFQRSRC